MSYRKFTADYIFTGHRLLGSNAVLITNTEGKILEITEAQNAGDDVEYHPGLLTPGFINAHCHMELSHLKNKIPPGAGLIDFVQQVMKKRLTAEEEKQQAMYQAGEELEKGGTIAVGDICNTADSISIKQKTKINWYNFVEVSGFTDSQAHVRFAAGQALEKQFADRQMPSTIVPHAPYSVSRTLFGLLNNASVGKISTIHNQECRAEDVLYYSGSGDFLQLYKNMAIDNSSFLPTEKSSLQSWVPYFSSGQTIIAVHNTFTSEEDILLTASPKMFYCLCINANRYIENALPPIDIFHRNNCRIVIGTDSYASNWQLNMLSEIRSICEATKFSIPLPEVLSWATINGASALGMDSFLGSFEKEKLPGIVLINNLNGENLSADSVATRIL